jgi:PAS domain S-box-containing protein
MDCNSVQPMVDLTNCESEPIRYPGTVQPHGALLVVDKASGTIDAASESCKTFLGLSAQQLLGQSIGSCLGHDVESTLLAKPNIDTHPLPPLSMNGRQLCARYSLNDSGQVLLELETDGPDALTLQGLAYKCREGVRVMRQLGSVAQISKAAAELVRDISGLDQVMIYRFDAAWNGEIIAEARAANVESYLGLNFPASDIPRQARELFQLCRVRLIPDTHYVPSALLAKGDGRAIDLGRSGLRSVSPIHIEYLKNMGARATLVAALVVEGHLWGLLSCQQKHEPRYLGPAERDTIGGLCEDIAAMIQEAQLRETRDREQNLASRRQSLVAAVRRDAFSELMQPGKNTDLLGVVGADGFALVTDERIRTTGMTPEIGRVRELLKRRNERQPSSTLFATNALCHDLAVETIDDGIAGALFVSVLRQPWVTMIWFRCERSYSVRWGGDPGRPHFTDPSGRLSPRKSFDLFLQTIQGQSLAWSPEEVTSAAELGSLIDIEGLRRQEAFSSTILNSIPEHICVLDAEGVIVTVNEPWKEFARSGGALNLAEEGVGVSYLETCVAAGDDGLAAKEGIEAVLKGRLDSFVLDYPCDSPDERRWFRMRVSPMLPPVEGVMVAHEDITQTKVLEVDLQRSRQSLMLALLGSDLGTWDWDILGGNMLFDKRWCSMLGYRVDEVDPTVSGWERLVHPDDWPAIKSALESHLKGDTPQYESEHRLRHKDGHWVWLLDRGKVVERNGEGKALRAAGTLLDISDRKQLKLEGTELLRRIESLIAGLDQRPNRNPAADTSPPQGLRKTEQLTLRQREVLTLVATGLTSAEIADRLNISRTTAITHRRDLMRKLGLHSTAELTRYAIQTKLVSG